MKERFLFPFAILILAISSCRESYDIVREDSLEKEANVRISNFTRYNQTVSGRKIWKLTAKEAYLYRQDQTESKIIVYNFSFEQFNENEQSTGLLTADRGEVNYQDQKMLLTGNIVSTDETGRLLRGQKMTYDIESKILSSDETVTIIEKGLSTVCRRGVLVDRESGRQICRSPAGEHVRTQGSQDFDDVFH